MLETFTRAKSKLILYLEMAVQMCIFPVEIIHNPKVLRWYRVNKSLRVRDPSCAHDRGGAGAGLRDSARTLGGLCMSEIIF